MIEKPIPKQLSQKIQNIVKFCHTHNVSHPPQIQYVVATALWESNFTLEPRKEAYWVRNWDKYIRTNAITKRYYPYYGRGLVQLTGKQNYQTFSELLGLDLVKKPDLALDEDTSMRILVLGMRDGLFTGRSLSKYINSHQVNFVEARYIINGRDKRQQIATLASGVDILACTYTKY